MVHRGHPQRGEGGLQWGPIEVGQRSEGYIQVVLQYLQTEEVLLRYIDSPPRLPAVHRPRKRGWSHRETPGGRLGSRCTPSGLSLLAAFPAPRPAQLPPGKILGLGPGEKQGEQCSALSPLPRDSAQVSVHARKELALQDADRRAQSTPHEVTLENNSRTPNIKHQAS